MLAIADSEERKYKDAGVPWKSTIVQDVKRASLSLLLKYMKLTKEEVHRIETSKEQNDQKSKKCHDLLTGVMSLILCKLIFFSNKSNVLTL